MPRPPNIETNLYAKKESSSPRIPPTPRKCQSAGLKSNRRKRVNAAPYPNAQQRSVHRYKTRLSLAKNTYTLNHKPYPALKNSTPTPLCAYHFQFPGISIAFSDGDYDATSLVAEGSTSGGWSNFETITHVIRLSHLSARVPRKCHHRKYPPHKRPIFRNGHAWPDYDAASGVATLDLIIPQEPALISDKTRITEAQMLMTQDFLDLVLPCPEPPQGWPGNMKRISDPFNILITAPLPSPRKVSAARGQFEDTRSQDAHLSQSSRDILALVEGTNIKSRSEIGQEVREILSYLEGKLQTARR